jgi:hypothetical protein
METQQQKNLALAILAVMKEVKGIDKTMTIGSGNNSYKGVPDQEVKKIIGASMEKNGLCILPIETKPKTQIDRWETTYNGTPQTKQSVFTEVETKYLLLHSSGESQVISGYGHGIDSQDKGAGKATTYALKYALLYTFLVPTGKIDDADTTHSDEIKTPPPVKKEKPYLNENSEAFEKAQKFIADGGSLVDIEKKYTVSEAVKKILIPN